MQQVRLPFLFHFNGKNQFFWLNSHMAEKVYFPTVTFISARSAAMSDREKKTVFVYIYICGRASSKQYAYVAYADELISWRHASQFMIVEIWLLFYVFIFHSNVLTSEFLSLSLYVSRSFYHANVRKLNTRIKKSYFFPNHNNNSTLSW